MPQDVVIVVDQVVEVSGESFSTAVATSMPVVSAKWSTTMATPIVQLIENEILKVGPPAYCTVY